MDVNTVIIDNFLLNPDMVREQAIQLEYPFTGQFPGMRSHACDDEYQKFFTTRISDILNVRIHEYVMDSFCFQLCYEGSKTWIHKDGCDWAGVLFLSPDAPLESGTGLYNDKDELVTALGNVYNRLVLYKGNLNHSSMLAGFGNTPASGRLTQVFFFNAETTLNQNVVGWDTSS